MGKFVLIVVLSSFVFQATAQHQNSVVPSPPAEAPSARTASEDFQVQSCQDLAKLKPPYALSKNNPDQSFRKKLIGFIADHEFSGKLSGIVGTNPHEYFLSVGLGHYLWYFSDNKYSKSNPKPKYVESLPLLTKKLMNLRNSDGSFKYPLNEFPAILVDQSTGEFRAADVSFLNNYPFVKGKSPGPGAKTLIEFFSRAEVLQDSLDFQMEGLLKKLVAVCETKQDYENRVSPEDKARYIAKLLEDPRGWFALIDYINFKGDGMKSDERYIYQPSAHSRSKSYYAPFSQLRVKPVVRQPMGWGLSQVLDNATLGYPVKGTGSALQNFATSAEHILAARAAAHRENNSGEFYTRQFFSGWQKRAQRYTQSVDHYYSVYSEIAH